MITDLTDNLPSYPSGLDVYPESYKIVVPKDKLHPVGLEASVTPQYKVTYQEILRRSDTLLGHDSEGKSCFILEDMIIGYISNSGQTFVFEDGYVVNTTDVTSMLKTIDTYLNSVRKRAKSGSGKTDPNGGEETPSGGTTPSGNTEVDYEAMQQAGAVMYDHPLLMGMSATQLAELIDSVENNPEGAVNYNNALNAGMTATQLVEQMENS